MTRFRNEKKSLQSSMLRSDKYKKKNRYKTPNMLNLIVRLFPIFCIMLVEKSGQKKFKVIETTSTKNTPPWKFSKNASCCIFHR